MKKKNALIMSAILLVMTMLVGCVTTIRDVLSGKEKGITMQYALPVDKAYKVAYTVLRWSSDGLIEDHREEGYLLTANGKYQSQLIAVWFDSVRVDTTAITFVAANGVISQKREQKLHSYYQEAVQKIRAGEKLPIQRPDWLKAIDASIDN